MSVGIGWFDAIERGRAARNNRSRQLYLEGELPATRESRLAQERKVAEAEQRRLAAYDAKQKANEAAHLEMQRLVGLCSDAYALGPRLIAERDQALTDGDLDRAVDCLLRADASRRVAEHLEALIGRRFGGLGTNLIRRA